MRHCFRIVMGTLAFAASAGLEARNPTGAADGAAGGNAAINSEVPACPSTYGDLAVKGIDPGLNSLLRRYILQSHCFRITSQLNYGAEGNMNGMNDQNMSGRFRPSSKHGPNQRVGGNYYMEATVNYGGSSNTRTAVNTGGLLGMALGAATNKRGGAATVTLEVYEANAQVLIASATGRGKAGQWSVPFTTPDGDPLTQAMDAATYDAFRQIVPALINYRKQEISDGHLDVQ